MSYERALTNAFGPWLSAEQARKSCPRAWAALAEEARERAEETDCVASLWGALPMGDGNAISFSQEAHANILSAGGCMRPADLPPVLKLWFFGRPVLFVLTTGNTHLFERGQGCQNRTADPSE